MEPAAVPRPRALERRSAGTMRPKAASTMAKDEPATPRPTRSPRERVSVVGVPEKAMRKTPTA